MSDKNDMWAGFEVISRYTRNQAISDGVLADLSAICPDVCKEIYPGISVACTEAVWRDVQKAVASEKHCNDLPGVIHDLLWMSKQLLESAVKRGDTEYIFRCIITGIAFRTLHNFKCCLGVADDEKTPAITIMYPTED